MHRHPQEPELEHIVKCHYAYIGDYAVCVIQHKNTMTDMIVSENNGENYRPILNQSG